MGDINRKKKSRKRKQRRKRLQVGPTMTLDEALTANNPRVLPDFNDLKERFNRTTAPEPSNFTPTGVTNLLGIESRTQKPPSQPQSLGRFGEFIARANPGIAHAAPIIANRPQNNASNNRGLNFLPDMNFGVPVSPNFMNAPLLNRFGGRNTRTPEVPLRSQLQQQQRSQAPPQQPQFLPPNGINPGLLSMIAAFGQALGGDTVGGRLSQAAGEFAQNKAFGNFQDQVAGRRPENRLNNIAVSPQAQSHAIAQHNAGMPKWRVVQMSDGSLRRVQAETGKVETVLGAPSKPPDILGEIQLDDGFVYNKVLLPDGSVVTQPIYDEFGQQVRKYEKPTATSTPKISAHGEAAKRLNAEADAKEAFRERTPSDAKEIAEYFREVNALAQQIEASRGGTQEVPVRTATDENGNKIGLFGNERDGYRLKRIPK